MNHHVSIHGDYARILMEQRAKAARMPRPERRSTRKTLALRLHRMADRLDGS
jgi:hypothetical protein